MAVRGPLLFDLDGTLVDTAIDIAAALSRLSQSRGGGTVSPERVRPLVSGGVETLVCESLGVVAGGKAAENIAAFRRLLAEAPPDPASVYPGVVAALDTFALQGTPMGIVTNKPERLARLLLDGLGLSDRFGAVVGGDTLAVRKPNRAPLDHALALLGAAPGDAIMVGDSAIDAAAARGAKLPFVLFEGGYGAADCVAGDVAARFARFTDLAAVLGKFATPKRDRNAA